MKLPTTIILATLMFFLNGCATKRFSQFSGRQAVWPMTDGAMAEHNNAVPVYRSWPEKPYRVLGSIRFANPRNEWKDGDTAHAARIAKSKGGEAIIMRYGGEWGVGALVGGAEDAKVWAISEITTLVIKWKTAEELAKEVSALRAFKADFKQKYPDLSNKAEVLDLSVEYLQWLGVALNSGEFEEKTRNLLSMLNRAAGEESTSQWLFKGNIRSGSLTSSSSYPVYGLASVSIKAGSASIIATEGKTSLNFSGTLQDGRLAGQMGFSMGATIVSARAEGAVLGDKLSLTSQTQTADGTFQGSFSFIH